MRTLSIGLLLFILINNIRAQRFEDHDFSATSVKVTFSNDFINKIEPLRALIEGYFFEGQGSDRVKALIVHNTFATFKYMTEEQLSIAILPPNVLGKKSKYDEYGYPDITVQKAIDKRASKFFYKLHVNYESMSLKNYYYVDSLLGPGQKVEDIEMNYLIPRVSITWNIYNKDGTLPIKTYSSNAVSKKPITVKKCLMHNYLPSRYTGIKKCDDETLMEILELAIHDLIVTFLDD